MLYPIVVTVHSILRWLIVLAALFAIIRAATGISFKRGWMQMDSNAGMWYTSLLDLQVLVGILLYFFLSPTTKGILQNFGATTASPAGLFFGVEHVIGMLIAVVLAHVGRVMVRRIDLSKVQDSKVRQNLSVQKHRRAALWTILSLLIILAAIPWPFLSYGKPLI